VVPQGGALEARLLRNADRLDAAPRRAASPGRPRAPRPATAPSADEANSRVTHLPTPEQIAAKVRRQLIGTVFADICRDLGILPGHPLWRGLQIAVIKECGNFTHLVKDILDQAFPSNLDPRAWAAARSSFDRSVVLRQNSSPFFSIPWMPFSPFTVCVTWKSTASEQN
jgi:hypothetical protein